MTDQSTVNNQITDSVTQANTTLLGNSASGAMSLLDIVNAETLGMSMHNAVSSQHNSQMSSAAAVTATCAKMLAVSPPSPKSIPEPEPDLPPPFMPLDPAGSGNDKTASELVREATAMAEKAIQMIGDSDEKTDKDVSVLQGLMSKIKTLTGSTESVTPSNDSTKKPDENKSS